MRELCVTVEKVRIITLGSVDGHKFREKMLYGFNRLDYTELLTRLDRETLELLFNIVHDECDTCWPPVGICVRNEKQERTPN